jgi:septum formation protein
MIILASQSKARRDMLIAAGLRFESVPADINEEAIQRSALPPAEIANTLAQEKALTVSSAHPGAHVIGADQVLSFEGQVMGKPATPRQAKERLTLMRGKSHDLISAAAIARDGKIVWHKTETARMIMADMDDDFLAAYCARAGSALTQTVGGYEIEGPGAALFERIEGDYFVVLGMPLLDILSWLRRAGAFEI